MNDAEPDLLADNSRLQAEVATLRVSNGKLAAENAALSLRLADFDKAVAGEIVKYGIVIPTAAQQIARANVKRNLDEEFAELKKANPDIVTPPYIKK